jgi:hypothetical protein
MHGGVTGKASDGLPMSIEVTNVTSKFHAGFASNAVSAKGAKYG